MKKLLALSAVCTLLASTAMANWSHEATIDVTDDVNGALKSIAASPDGGTLYLTTYFGEGTRPIYSVSDPLGTLTVGTFADPAYASTNGSGVAVDPSGNVFFTHDTNFEASSYINKYDASGNLIAGFGAGGSLNPVVFNVEGTPTDRRPRESGWATADHLLTMSWGTPMLLQVLDANSGAPVGPSINTGTGTGISDAFVGLAYDPVANHIIGTARGTAWTIGSTNPSATLDNLADYDQYTQLAGDVFASGQSNIGGSWDEATNLYAFTSSKARPDGTVTVVGVADPANQTVLGLDTVLGDPGHLGLSGDVAFFRQNGGLYLAVSVENAANAGDPVVRHVVIFAYDDPTSVDDWTIMY